MVVTHDFDLKRNCGVDGEVDSFTFEELSEFPVFYSQERIPLFEDVLKVIDGKVPLIVELKYKNGSKICEKANEILKEYKGVYCIESFHPQVLMWYKKNRPDVYRGQLSMNYQKYQHWHQAQYYMMRYLLTDFVTDPDFVAYDCRSKNALSLWIARKICGRKAFAWTVKSEKELKYVKKKFDSYIFEGFRP